MVQYEGIARLARVMRQAARAGGRARGAQSCAVDHSTSHKVKEND